MWSLFFFNDTTTTEIYTYLHTLSLHDALPICQSGVAVEYHQRRLDRIDFAMTRIVGFDAVDDRRPAVASLDRQRRAVDEVVDRDQRLQLAAEAFLVEQLDRGRRQRRGVAALGGERKLVLLATDLRVVLSGRHEHIRARVHRCGVWHLLVAELRVEPTLRGIVEDADECRIGWRRGRIQAGMRLQCGGAERGRKQDRKSTRLNSSH